MPAAKNKKKSLNLCKDVPNGEVLTDLRKGQWITGKSIGSGGFGFIYLAQKKKDENTKVSNNASYVVKIEPHGNGPLFCETTFYQRAAKEEKIEEWRKSKKMKYFPVPHYIASGLHNLDGKRLRFLVMPKYGLDLHKLWTEAGKRFQQATVIKIGISLLHALEYLHQNEYVHADIKGANILCGAKDSSQIFLVDYGLAYRYIDNGKHKTGKPDPRRAHNGTIEYTSTDAHIGSNPSRRGDIEILGFVLLHWLAGSLPWEKDLTKPEKVRDQKNELLDNVKSAVKRLCPKKTPDEIITVLEHSRKLEYEEAPDYQMLHNAFEKTLKNLKVKANSVIDWNPPTSTASGKVSKSQARPLASKTNEGDIEEQPRSPVKAKRARKSPKAKKVSVEETTEDDDTDAKGETSARKKKINTTTTAKKVERKSRKVATKAVKIEETSEDDDDSDDSFALPQPKPRSGLVNKNIDMLMTSDTDDYQTPPQSKRAKKTTSRYSMAPLHTQPVLVHGDKLTGKKKGKHPEYKRKARKNVVKSDANTQTTPSLKLRRTRNINKT